MPTIMPQSELLRKAVVFVDESRRDEPGANLGKLLDEAGMRFNLSPLDSEALWRLFSAAGKSGGASGDDYAEPVA